MQNNFERSSSLSEFSASSEKKVRDHVERIDSIAHRFYILIESTVEDPDKKKSLRNAFDAIIEGGALLVEKKDSVVADTKPLENSRTDIVTAADLESQTRILDELKKVNDEKLTYFIGEEGKVGNPMAESRFYLDSLDGTRAYVAGYNDYSISLAHEKGNKLDYGMIYVPEKQELFYAGDQKAFHVSADELGLVIANPRRFEESVYYSDFSDIPEAEETNEAMAKFWAELKGSHQVLKDVRYSSAAYGIADTVSKNGNVFVGFDLQKVDVAAAAYFASSAGAKLWTNINESSPGFIVVTNPEPDNMKLLQGLVHKYFPEYARRAYEFNPAEAMVK